MSQTIVVGSMNPVKANSVRRAFERMFPDQSFATENVPASSGVPSQPISDDETLQGARNRRIHAREHRPDADFWVGIEGGVEDSQTGMNAFAWISVQSQSALGEARTATFPLPPPLARLIHDGVELGLATDQLFQVENTKLQGGAIGVLSNNVVDRTMLYEHAAIMALVPIMHAELYRSQDV